jgi:alkaline phosphatase D
VDDRTVRIWVRSPGQPSVDAVLTVDGLAPLQQSASLSEDTDWCGVILFTLSAPAPGRSFTCHGASRTLIGRMAPSLGTPSPLAFAFGSCNRPFEEGPAGEIIYNQAAGIYSAMCEDLEGAKAELLLLVGDQLYSDEIAQISVRDNLPGDENSPPPDAVAVDAYRQVYRGYLNPPRFRALRESRPTYCIWDDHDIFKTWGSRLEETPLDKTMFRAASRAYTEYQHIRNPDGSPEDSPPFNYTFEFGDIGFLVLDVRGARDYEAKTILGSEQWADVRSYLAGPKAAKVSTLFVVSSIPLAHTARWVGLIFSRLKGKYGDQLRDRWCANAFVGARDKLLNALCDWQIAAQGRQVIVLSGDIHVANAFTIRRREGGGVIEQFTSSALTTLSETSHRRINQLVTRWTNLFEPRFRFEKHFLAFENNFGLVKLKPRVDGGHDVTFEVRGWDPDAASLSTTARRRVAPAHKPRLEA